MGNQRGFFNLAAFAKVFNSELQEMTGYKLLTKQVGWLLNRGYFVETNARGIPRITYSQVDDMRRFNTPMHLHILNKTLEVNDQIFKGEYLNNPKQGAVSEPNINNLLNKINRVVANG